MRTMNDARHISRDELSNLCEGWDFEAKLAIGRDGRGAVPDSLWETYSAMANGWGGRILLGAKELNDGSLEPRGIDDIDTVEGDLWNLLRNPQKVSINLLQQEDVERLEVDGSFLLLLNIPRAPRADRPVHIKGSLEQGTYIRVHEGDRHVSADTGALSVPKVDLQRAVEREFPPDMEYTSRVFTVRRTLGLTSPAGVSLTPPGDLIELDAAFGELRP